MSETIRDQALKAALSILDSHRKIAFVTFKYKSRSEPNQAKEARYVAKVTIAQAEQILTKRKDWLKPAEPKDEFATTIDQMISGTRVSLEQNANIKPIDQKIYGVILDHTGLPVVVEILEVFGYQKLSGLSTSVDSLKYLLTVLDSSELNEAVETEEKIVDAVTDRLQHQFSTQYAQNLLGQEGYNAVLSLLDKPQNNL